MGLKTRVVGGMLGIAAVAVAAPAVAGHGTRQGPPPTDPWAVALAWHVDIPLLLGLSIGAAAYLAAVMSVNARHAANRWPARRTAAFMAALVALTLALVSPIDTFSGDLLTVHMVQHLLLVSVAAPLFAASGIGTLALRAASADNRKRFLLPILHSRIVSVLTFPVIGWVAFVGVMWGSHLSSLYNAALLDDTIHALEHLLYLGAAALFWWPLLSPDPLRWRLHPLAKLAALIAQMPPMSFLAVTILSAAAPLYASYIGRTDAFGVDALSDQKMAGSLMWVTGDLALIVPGIAILASLVRHEEAEARRIDAHLDRQRAVAAARKET